MIPFIPIYNFFLKIVLNIFELEMVTYNEASCENSIKMMYIRATKKANYSE
jgi:hypothetical protein